MRTKSLDSDNAQDIADFINSFDKPKSVSMSMSQYRAFRLEFDIVMRGNQPTFNGAKITINIGDDSKVWVEYD